jgi:hypothetical protein
VDFFFFLSMEGKAAAEPPEVAGVYRALRE